MNANTAGSQFVKTAAKYFGIGATTKRFRNGDAVIPHVKQSVMLAATAPGYYSPETEQALRPAFNVLLGWESHVESYRIKGEIVQQLNQLSPYQFLKLIARMIDDGVSTSWEFDQWFRNKWAA